MDSPPSSSLSSLSDMEESASSTPTAPQPLPIISSVVYSMRITKLFPLANDKDLSGASSPILAGGVRTPEDSDDEDQICQIGKFPAVPPSNSLAIGLDFSGNGQFLAGTSRDNHVTIFDCQHGMYVRYHFYLRG